MRLETIELSAIDRSGRLRASHSGWVATMAETAGASPRWPAIDVVETAPGAYRLLDGERRCAAMLLQGGSLIEARVFSRAEFADEAAERLHEIQTSIVRQSVTALDRAVYLNEWKGLHEAVTGPAKRGRKPAAELAQSSAPIFSEAFSPVAAATLGISERSVQVYVQVARGIPAELRQRLAAHPIADKMSELLALCAETADRQEKIVALLLAEPPQAVSVAEAVALIDRLPAPKQLEFWESTAAKLNKLRPEEQDLLFDALAPSIERWMAGRLARKAA